MSAPPPPTIIGLSWEVLRKRNPELMMVRMPAFGLDGPWRDRPGFGQTIEQISGMACVTGYSPEEPVVPRGPSDPLAGIHALLALLVALESRDRNGGGGALIEVTMVECGLNVAAEVTLEYSAYNQNLGPPGNRGPTADPQGVYPCRGNEQWVALAVETDEHWRCLTAIIGKASWAKEDRFDTVPGRHAAANEVDRYLTAWMQSQNRDEIVERLLAAGIPAAPVLLSEESKKVAQLEDRRFFEPVQHPLFGTEDVAGLPFKVTSGLAGWIRRAAPTLGQHNAEILGGELGLTDDELEQLTSTGIIGEAWLHA